MTGSKKQVFYIHGGNSYSNHELFLDSLKNKDIRELPWSEVLKKWPSTLRTELGDEYEVFMPEMPNKLNAQYKEWQIWFERHFEHVHDDVILVGWSLGGYFLAKYLIENNPPFKIKALFLLAAPFESKDLGDEDCQSFSFDVDRVGELAKKADNITIFHSKDDFLVPYDHALKYKAQLPTAELVTFEDKNHFLIAELPELLDRVRGL